MELHHLILLSVAAPLVIAAIFWRPALGVGLILLFAHFERTFMLGGHSAAKLITVLCVGILALRLLVNRDKLRLDGTMIFALLFVGWFSLTLLWNREPAGSLKNLESFILQCFLFFLFLNLITSKEDLKLALWGQIIGGTVLAVILTNTMMTQNFLRKTEIAELGINLAARMVGLNLLFAFLLYQIEKKRLRKIILLVSVVLSAIGSVVSLSRGNWYGVVISLAVLFMIYLIKGQRQFTFQQAFVWTFLGLIAFVLLDTMIFTQHGASKLSDRFSSAVTFSDSASQRFDIWQAAWGMFLQSPVWGIGFDSFARENPFYHKPAHNAYVLVAVEAGVIGLSLYLLLLGSVFRKLWNLFLQPSTHLASLACASALFTFLLVVSMVDSAVDRKYLWYVLALIILLVRYYGDDESTAPILHTADNEKPEAVGWAIASHERKDHGIHAPATRQFSV